MLSELNQLLTCRREREDRAAMVLRQARLHHAQMQAAAAEAATKLDSHEEERRTRQTGLYKQSLRSRMTPQQIDDLNIELDLMAEATDGLVNRLRDAEDRVRAAAETIEEAAAAYRKHRQASDRWKLLVDDVAEKDRRERDIAEEFAVEDEVGDRQASQSNGGW